MGGCYSEMSFSLVENRLGCISPTTALISELSGFFFLFGSIAEDSPNMDPAVKASMSCC